MLNMGSETRQDVARQEPPSLPQPVPERAGVPPPVDVPYPGTITLCVDVSDVTRRIFRATQVIPVSAAGPMTLLYPKWLPGFHAPQAPIELLAGLEINAEGTELRWVRHPVAVNAFEIEVPEGATEIHASFQFLSPTEEAHGRVLATPDMLMLPWNTVVLYPAGHFARGIDILPSLVLPDGWDLATALEGDSRDGSTVRFKTTTLDALVDSPVMAGRHFKAVDLDDTGEVRLNVVADRPELLAMDSARVEPHRAVVAQCDKLFGARHFRRYDVLLALSEELTSAGIEHHQSCEAVSLASYSPSGTATSPGATPSRMSMSIVGMASTGAARIHGRRISSSRSGTA